jgi:hypothetical protein
MSETKLSAKAHLECLISAINNIEGGFYVDVATWIAQANAGLQEIGSPYRYCSTGKIRNEASLAEGLYVDNVYIDQVVVKMKGET